MYTGEREKKVASATIIYCNVLKAKAKKKVEKDVKNDDENLEVIHARPLIHFGVFFCWKILTPCKKATVKIAIQATNYMNIRVLEVLQSQLLLSF